MSPNNPNILHVGLDVAKLSLQLHLAGRFHSLANDAKGHAQLLKLLRVHAHAHVVCEATGGYEQAVVRVLQAAAIPVSIVEAGRVGRGSFGASLRPSLVRGWLATVSPQTTRGVRHELSLIFQELARCDATLWIPGDVYPVYLELARAAGIQPRLFKTLPEPKIPANHSNGNPEYLLITNPWKPLGRYLTDKECDALTGWLAASPHRQLLMDCVYDLGAPFHVTTQKLHGTGRAILLHSATKGWLWPKTFGVALLGDGHSQFESAFRNDSPTPDQLRLAQQFLSTETNCPSQVIAVLQSRAKKLFAAMPDSVRKSLLLDPACLAPSCYFFPVGIRAEELLRQHRLLAIPSSAFGADWDGSILTSLASAFAPVKSGGAQ